MQLLHYRLSKVIIVFSVNGAASGVSHEVAQPEFQESENKSKYAFSEVPVSRLAEP